MKRSSITAQHYNLEKKETLQTRAIRAGREDVTIHVINNNCRQDIRQFYGPLLLLSKGIFIFVSRRQVTNASEELQNSCSV